MDIKRAFPFNYLNSVIFIFTICIFVQSVSGWSSWNKYDSSVSADALAPSSSDEMSTQLTVSIVSPSRKTKLKKHKKYEPSSFISFETIKPFSMPYEKSFWKFKLITLMKKPIQPNKYLPLILGNIYGVDPFRTPEKSAKFFSKPKKLTKTFRRSRRQAPLNTTEAEATVDDDAEGSDFVGHTRPKPTPQPPRTEQYAIQKSETGQSQSQISGATDTDNMNYNPDGSIKSHNLGSSSTNKQETSQFQRSETMIPISGPVSTSEILGTNGTGGQSNFFTGSQLGPLPALPEMQPMQQASTSGRGRRRGSRNKAENTKTNSKGRSLGGPDESESSEEDREPTTQNSNGKVSHGYQKSSSNSSSFRNSNKNSTSSEYGDAPPGVMTLDSSSDGVLMVLPIQNQLPDLFENTPMKSGRFSQFQPMGQGQFVQGQQVLFSQGQPGHFQQGHYGNVMQVYPGQFSQGQPEQFSQGFPGQFSQGFPGQFSQGFPGQFSQGLPGQFSQGLPGQMIPGLPGQFPQGQLGQFQQGIPGQFPPGVNG